MSGDPAPVRGRVYRLAGAAAFLGFLGGRGRRGGLANLPIAFRGCGSADRKRGDTAVCDVGDVAGVRARGA